MSKILSIFLLFSIASADAKPAESLPDLISTLITSTPKECIGEVSGLASKFKEIKSKYNSKFDSVDVLYNRDLILSLIGDLRIVSTSIQSSNCSVIIFTKYFLDGTVFIGDTIYGKAFSCLSHENLESHFFTCSRGMVPENSDVLEYLKPVGHCVANKLKCSQEDQKSFIRAVYAGVDLYDKLSDAKSTLKSLEKQKNKLEFNPKVYSHLLD